MKAEWICQLAFLLLRKRMFWIAMLPFWLAACTGWLIFGVSTSLTLSAQQSATESLGSADGVLNTGIHALPGSQSVAGVASERAFPRLQSAILWRGEQRSISLEEMSYPNPVTSGRLRLISGRWPETAREVALSPTLHQRATGEMLKAQTGDLQVRVVGVVQSVYQQDVDLVYAGVGTWSTWVMSEQAAAQLGVSATVDVLWRGEMPAELAALARDSAETTHITTREQLINQLTGVSAKILLERGFAIALLVPLGALIAAVLMGRWSRSTTRVLSELGSSLTGLRIAQALALGIGTACTATVAAGTSYAMLAAIRGFLRRSATQPLHPWPWMGTLIVVSSFASCLVAVATVVTVRRLSRQIRPARMLSARGRTSLWMVGTLALIGAGVCSVIGGRGFAGLAAVGLLVAVAGACAAPLIVEFLIRGGGTPGPGLWARRALANDLRRYAVVLVAGTAITTLAATTLGLAGATVAHLNATSTTGVPRGMVMFNAAIEGLPPATEEQVAQFNTALGAVPRAEIARTAVSVSGQTGEEWAFASPDQAVDTLGPQTRGVLERLQSDSVIPTSSDPVPGDKWSLPTDLRSVVQIKVGEPSEGVRFGKALLYTHLTPEQERIAYRWAESNGLATAYVVAPSQGARIPIPVSAQLSGFGFGLAVLLLVFGAIRGEVARLRPLLNGIAALGLGRVWLRSGLLWLGGLMGVAISVCSVFGVAAGLSLGRVLMGPVLPVMSAPWLGIVAICSAGILGAISAALVAGRRSALVTW